MKLVSLLICITLLLHSTVSLYAQPTNLILDIQSTEMTIKRNYKGLQVGGGLAVGIGVPIFISGMAVALIGGIFGGTNLLWKGIGIAFIGEINIGIGVAFVINGGITKRKYIRRMKGNK